ncbi:MAG: cryptochrome/photolyase family protein [Chitinophagaceae bacterium]|nr:MAG: cryptochrome/photolyase family protein [Chitinophagaceae bacterium]
MSSHSASGTIVLVFPHQLFMPHPAIQKDSIVYLVEEELFFTLYRFHKKKLVFHRASMKAYAEWLGKKVAKVNYIETGDELSEITNLVRSFKRKTGSVSYADVHDDWLQQRISKAAADAGLDTIVHPTPAFLSTMEEVNPFFEKAGTYFQTSFYIAERKKRGILVDGKAQPTGGKWSFDGDNRLRLPKDLPIPETSLPRNRRYVPEAIDYIEKKFPDNYGNTEPPFFKGSGFFPVTHEEAVKWLHQFLEERLANFGAYEDAMRPNEAVLFHSGLSPLINVGLLTPQQVLDALFTHVAEAKTAINSVEGFTRQLIGWREFIRIVYMREGRRQRSKNYWGFTRRIPLSFWEGNTGIEPVDTVITKVLQSAYSHHIERLMVMGNFMLLCEFNPDEVYQWFMEMYIDAYDWVMVPNTYGMTQFADGGLMTTKPYISGSNYLMKMGSWKKGEWQGIWDGLFWRFMSVHRSFFESNPRLGMLLKTLDKMDNQTRDTHFATAEKFLARLDREKPGIP